MTIKQVSIVTVQFSLRFNDAQMFVNKSMFRTNPARHASFRYMTNNKIDHMVFVAKEYGGPTETDSQFILQ